MVKTGKPKKTKMVNFKLSDEQYSALQEVADVYADGNMSALIRRWILGAISDLDRKKAAETKSAAAAQ